MNTRLPKQNTVKFSVIDRTAGKQDAELWRNSGPGGPACPLSGLRLFTGDFNGWLDWNLGKHVTRGLQKCSKRLLYLVFFFFFNTWGDPLAYLLPNL